MKLTVVIPDDVGARLRAEGKDIERLVLEAFAAEEYRAGRITKAEVRRALGFETPIALDAFCKARGIFERYEMSDFQEDQAALDRILPRHERGAT